MIIPPSISFKGNQFTAISLKAKAIKFYHYIANQADLGGVGYVARNIAINGSLISISSYKEGNYGNRFGNIIIFGKYESGIILPEYDIVVWPISASFVNGKTPNPRVGMKYVEGTPTDKLFITNQIDDSVDGGNCYWRDSEGKNVISWEGPWGFQIAPRYNTYWEGEPYIFSSAAGYTPKYTGFRTSGGILSRISLPLTTVYDSTVATYTRFSDKIYKEGGVLTTTPYPVLGCGIVADNLLAVVNVSYDKDRVIVKKLNAPSSWTTVCDINYTDTSTMAYLERQGVYTFSQNGLKIISVVQRYDGYGISDMVQTVKISRDTIVRITLNTTPGGSVSHVSTTYTDDAYTASTTPYSQQFISAGFVNNVEKLLTYEIGDYSGASNLIPDTSYSQDYQSNIKFYLGTTELFTANPGPFVQEFSLFEDLTGSGTSTYSCKDYDLTIFFVDIEKGVIVLESDKYTHSATQLSSDLSGTSSIAIETKVTSKNKTTTIGNDTYSLSHCLSTIGSSISSSLPTNNQHLQYLNTVRPFAINHMSKIKIPHIGLEYSSPPFLDSLPICKGVVDKRSNFVGQITCRYTSSLDAVSGAAIATHCTQNIYNESSIPYNGDASAIFTGIGPITSISGETLPASNRIRKIFLIN